MPQDPICVQSQNASALVCRVSECLSLSKCILLFYATSLSHCVSLLSKMSVSIYISVSKSVSFIPSGEQRAVSAQFKYSYRKNIYRYRNRLYSVCCVYVCVLCTCACVYAYACALQGRTTCCEQAVKLHT